MSKALSIAAGLLLIVLVVVLAVQNSTLRNKFRAADDMAKLPYVGMYVPNTPAQTSRGQLVHLGQPVATAQVLYFFNTHCPYCFASVPAVRKLFTSLNDDPNAEFIPVSLDSETDTADYFHKMSMDMPYVSLESARSKALFHAKAVPVLMVVGQDGRIRFAHNTSLDVTDDVAAVLNAVANMER